MPNEKVAMLKKALILLFSNTFIYLSSAAYGPFLSAFYTNQGIPVTQIGTLLAVGPVAAVCIQPLWARLSDKTNRRRGMLMIVVAGTAVLLWGYYLHTSFAAYLLVTLFLSFFSTSIGPLCDTIVVQESRRLGMNFAHIRLGGTIGYSVMVLIAGRILDSFPNSLFGMASVLYVVMFLIVWRLPADRPKPLKKKKAELSDEDEPEAEPVQKGFLGIFQGREIIFVLLFALIAQIGASFYASYLGVYILDIGAGPYLGIVSCAAALSEIPVLLLVDRARRRFGVMPILVFCMGMTFIRTFIITSGSLPFVFLGQLFQGVSAIPIYFCCVMYISENVLPGKQSQGQSFLAILQAGVGSIIGNIGGGWLVEAVGLRPAYRMVAVVVLAIGTANLLAYLLYRRISARRQAQENFA